MLFSKEVRPRDTPMKQPIVGSKIRAAAMVHGLLFRHLLLTNNRRLVPPGAAFCNDVVKLISLSWP